MNSPPLLLGNAALMPSLPLLLSLAIIVPLVVSCASPTSIPKGFEDYPEVVYHYKGDYDRANQALAINLRDAKAYSNRGVVYSIGDPMQAVGSLAAASTDSGERYLSGTHHGTNTC